MEFKIALKEILKIEGDDALNNKSTIALLDSYGAFDSMPVFRSILNDIIEAGLGTLVINLFFSRFNDKGKAWNDLRDMIAEESSHDNVFVNLFFESLEYSLSSYAIEKGSSERELKTQMEESLGNIWVDDRGAKYSSNKKRLINGANVKDSYIINSETEIIESYAFHQMVGLNKIILPENLKEIGESAFHSCRNLAKVVFRNKDTMIGDYAFGACNSLLEIKLPEGLKKINDGLFSVSTNLLYVHIPKSVTCIGSYSFYACLSLQYLVIPDNVTTIGDNAFDYCNSLQYIVLPNGLKDIGGSLFEKCKSLESIYIPSGSYTRFNQLMPKYSHLFKEYSTEKAVYIGNKAENTLPFWVTRNGENVLHSFYSLEDSFTVSKLKDYEEGLNEMGIIKDKMGNRFYLSPILKYKSTAEILSLGSLITVANLSINCGKDWINYVYMNDYETFNTIFDTLSPIYNYELKGHSISSHVRQTDIMDYFIDEFGVVFSKDMKRLIKAPNNIVNFNIPDGVEVICDRAFEGCTMLKEIVFPDSVIFIGDYTFDCCIMLDSVIIPTSVKFIGIRAFAYCTRLRNLRLNSGLISIGDWAFDSCRLGNMSLPNTVVYIGKGAFKWCRGIKEMELPSSIKYIGSGAFLGLHFRNKPKLPSSVTNIIALFLNNPDFSYKRNELRFEYPDNLN